MSGLDLLRLQAEKGCKAQAGKILLLAADFSEDQRYQAEQLGCAVAGKPLQVSELFDWIAECENHLQSGRRLGTVQFYS